MEQPHACRAVAALYRRGVPDVLFYALGECQRRKQPFPYMLDHRAQARIADRLAVNAAHMRHFMTHDKIGGGLIFGFVGDGTEGVSQSIEAESLAAVDAEPAEQLRHFLA